MLLPLLYFEATEAVLLYLVSGVALKVETSRWLSSGKLVAPKEDNIQDTLRQMIAQSMAQLISSVTTIIAVFCCMLYQSVYLTLIVVVIVSFILQIVKETAVIILSGSRRRWEF